LLVQICLLEKPINILLKFSHEKAKEAMIYSYTKNINGFAAFLEEKEAADIAGNLQNNR